MMFLRRLRSRDRVVNNKILKLGGFIMTITKNSIIGDVLDKYPDTAELFFSIGMHCLGCPASRGETIAEACEVHGADADALIASLNNAIGE